jgi:hypothetical protein
MNDCIQIVNLQASQFGTGANQRYTINLAVYSALLEPLQKEATKLKEYEGHWRARIRQFQRDRRDVWWSVTNDDEARASAESMVEALAVPLDAMDAISSYNAILRIPRGPGSTSDDPPGGSSKWQVINAGREREGLPPSEAIENVDGARSSWHRRRYPDADADAS